MKTLEISGTIRTELGKSATKRLRREGFTSSVLYDKGNSIHFCTPLKEINKAIYTPETHLINLNIDNEVHQAIIKNIQSHYLHDHVLDVEFVKVDKEQPITVALPVKLVGTSEGVLAGGNLVLKLRKMKVKGLFQNLPNYIEVDISSLRLGHSIKVRDLKYEQFDIIMPSDLPVCSVEITRQLRQEASKAGKG